MPLALLCSAHGTPQSHQLSPGAAATPTARQPLQRSEATGAAAVALQQAALQQSPTPVAPVQQQQQQQAHGAAASGDEAAARAAAMLRAIQGSPPAQQQGQQQQQAQQPAEPRQQRLRTVGTGFDLCTVLGTSQHIWNQSLLRVSRVCMKAQHSAQLLLLQVSGLAQRAAATAAAARPTGAATAPAGGGLVAAAVLTEGVCSHDPATARAAAGVRAMSAISAVDTAQ